jgi:AraC-like DNA-binding protein
VDVRLPRSASNRLVEMEGIGNSGSNFHTEIDKPIFIFIYTFVDIQTGANWAERAQMGARSWSVEDWERLARQAGFQPAHMAAICRISLRQLERWIGKEFQKTPTQWLRELRCRSALELIDRGYSSKAAAAELKFANPSHFCHEFKKVYGSSPRMLTRTGLPARQVVNEQECRG